jgi:polysaccharide deacetylase family protein (PEP-CTERM system associated)
MNKPVVVPIATPSSRRMTNLLTFDVEDYFHAYGLSSSAPAGELHRPGRAARYAWAEMPGRVDYTTRRILTLLEEQGVQATFFVLGWVAEHYPDMVRAIAAGGHEIASHGYGHELLYEVTEARFREDIHRAKAVLEDLAGLPVIGYRAPSFSITPRTPWAPDVLLETGYRYDSSVFPIRRQRYGNPSSPRGVHWLREPAGGTPGLLEIPPSTIPILGQNIPVAGGGFFRFWPMAMTRWAIRRLNEHERMPAVVYLHPWEIDSDQPRLPASTGNGFRHYLNLHRTEPRLVQLMEEFRFAPVARVLADRLPLAIPAAAEPTRRQA